MRLRSARAVHQVRGRPLRVLRAEAVKGAVYLAAGFGAGLILVVCAMGLERAVTLRRMNRWLR